MANPKPVQAHCAHLLNSDQNYWRKRSSQQYFGHFKKNRKAFERRFVTMDKSWRYAQNKTAVKAVGASPLVCSKTEALGFIFSNYIKKLNTNWRILEHIFLAS